MRNVTRVFFLVLITAPFISKAQKTSKKRKHEIYFSWGYNKEWYTHSNLKVSQPSLGNSYTLQHISAHDHPGWDEGLFSKALSIPQYNYRLGYIIDRDKGWGVEINFDHTKYIIADQQASIKGTLNNKPVDSTINFNQANGFSYFLNNGANFLLFNLTKRWKFYADRKENVKLDLYAKAGVGPVIPHVENTLFGKSNDPHFQLGGWNVGLEGALRATFFKYVYLEYANKLDYARYSGLKIYEGKARQGFGTYEMILSLGVTFPVGRKE